MGLQLQVGCARHTFQSVETNVCPCVTSDHLKDQWFVYHTWEILPCSCRELRSSLGSALTVATELTWTGGCGTLGAGLLGMSIRTSSLFLFCLGFCNID